MKLKLRGATLIELRRELFDLLYTLQKLEGELDHKLTLIELIEFFRDEVYQKKEDAKIALNK